ncbi:MAG: ABC transporter ATP-binding protein [Candidatus Methanoperedens sp.]|nr:ABC transporter ATP-binding protein [Candidatus Methanoperedens sp.]
MNILEVKGLKTYFFTRRGIVKAVDDVSFDLKRGEVLCLVGESGSGKTVSALSILGLLEPPGRVMEGEVMLDGEELRQYTPEQLRRIRGKRIAMIFQDPSASLDPRMTAGDSIGEALLIHGMEDEVERLRRVEELLEEVGLERGHAYRYPHEFSGGQKQRIGIARALALRPSLIIADEPVSALDISIQAQILNLLTELKSEHKLSLLFIAHNMGVVRYLCDRVAVMKAGRIVEVGEVEEIFTSPQHAYTKALLEAAPVPNPHAKRL